MGIDRDFEMGIDRGFKVRINGDFEMRIDGGFEIEIDGGFEMEINGGFKNTTELASLTKICNVEYLPQWIFSTCSCNTVDEAFGLYKNFIGILMKTYSH